MESAKITPSGLEGITAGQTAISTVGKEGVGLQYRGYAIEDLADNACFEEVAYLLIDGKLPNARELTAYQTQLIQLRQLPTSLKTVLQLIPESCNPMDVLRTAVSMLGCLEPESTENPVSHLINRVSATLPAALLYWYHFQHSGQILNTNLDTSSTAAYFLLLLHNEYPDPLQMQALDASFILYAEHEFNASTFAARVTTATLSDYFSSITSAIGTLRGPLHGGANEEALKLIQSFATPAAAQAGIRQRLANKEKIMGFGHRVYRDTDPRSVIAKKLAKRLALQCDDKILFPIAEAIEITMKQEKNLFPNLDFYSALLYYYCGIPIELYTPLFVLARLSGWSAHILEQRRHNRLIRPIADYIGPPSRSFTPIQERH